MNEIMIYMTVCSSELSRLQHNLKYRLTGINIIRCCPQYDDKLMWRHRGNDIVSVAAICAATPLIFLFGRTGLAVYS